MERLLAQDNVANGAVHGRRENDAARLDEVIHREHPLCGLPHFVGIRGSLSYRLTEFVVEPF